MLKFYQHQEDFANKLYPNKKYLAWEVGTGKTIGALLTCQKHGMQKILVVAPRSAFNSWANDNQHFNLDLTVITYEKFRDKISDVSTFDVIIFDEAHKLSYTTTNWTKKAINLRPKMKNILMLSGTPADKLHKLYAQLRILTNGQDRMFQIYKSYTSFIKAYFELDDYFKPKKVIKKEYEAELREWFRKYAYVVKRSDVIELPDLITFLERLAPEKLEIDLSNYDLANFIKEYHASSLTKQKLEWVVDFIEENENTIVFSLFKGFVKQLADKLGKKAYVITGDTPKYVIDEVIKRQDKPIITTYVLSEGANLQRGYSNIVFASLPLKYIEYEQAIGRVYRAGQTNKVAVYTLLQQPIDYTVYSIIKAKKNVVDYLKRSQLCTDWEIPSSWVLSEG